MRDFLLFVRHLSNMLHFVRGVLATLLLILLAFALIVAKAEGLSLGESLYFIFITALTVGYGDIAPTSGATRVVSVLSGVVGIVFAGILVAVSVRALEHAILEKKRTKDAMTSRDDKP
jgi:voltage-gated potassium channel Kch